MIQNNPELYYLLAIIIMIIIVFFIIQYTKYLANKKQNEVIAKYQKERKKSNTLTSFKEKKSYFVEFTGIVLPRIDGENEIDSIKQITFSFKHKSKANKFLKIHITHDNENMYYEPPDSKTITPGINSTNCEPFSLEKIPDDFDSYKFLELIPSPIKTKYHFILLLDEKNRNKHFIHYNKTYCIGRSSIDYQPDISLEDPDEEFIDITIIKHDNLIPANIGLDVLGFSRKHLSIQMHGNELSAQLFEDKKPFYILDQEFKLREQIDNENQPVGKLQIGEYILVGNYLLRFGKN